MGRSPCTSKECLCLEIAVWGRRNVQWVVQGDGAEAPKPQEKNKHHSICECVVSMLNDPRPDAAFSGLPDPPI